MRGLKLRFRPGRSNWLANAKGNSYSPIVFLKQVIFVNAWLDSENMEDPVRFSADFDTVQMPLQRALHKTGVIELAKTEVLLQDSRFFHTF